MKYQYLCVESGEYLNWDDKYKFLYRRESSATNIDAKFRFTANDFIGEVEALPESEILESIRQSISIAWRLKELGHDDEAYEILDLAKEDFLDLRGAKMTECPHCGQRWYWDNGFMYCPFDGEELETVYENF